MEKMNENVIKSQELKPKQIAELSFWEDVKKNGCRGFAPEEWKIAVRHFRQYLLMYIGRNIGHLRNKVAIEVGCGPDCLLSNLPDTVSIGIDPLIDEYKKLWDLSKDNVEYICGEIETLDIDTKADVVICWNVLDHVSNIKIASKKLLEMLKPDGELWFMVNLEGSEDSTGIEENNPDSVHPYGVNINNISRLLEISGFLWKERVLIESQISKRPSVLMGVLCKKQWNKSGRKP